MKMQSLISLWLSIILALSDFSMSTWACLKLSENDRPVLFCQTSVSQLPLNSDAIPAKLSKLRILGTSKIGKHNGRLSLVNLTGLETLTYLEISSFELESIEVDAFKYMRQLRVLDLSRNRIRTIEPGSFSGLRLDLLSLTDNAGLKLVPGVFHGSEVKSIAARNCGLRSIDFLTVVEAKPKQLRLSHNQITTIDARFERIIKPWMSNSNSFVTDMEEWGFIDLTNNPLECNCQIAWLPRVMEEQLLAFQNDLSKQGQPNVKAQTALTVLSETNNELPVKRMYQLNLTCAGPMNLVGKPIPPSWTFFCPKPQIIGIVVNLLTQQADHAQLTCIGQGQPAPRLAWTYRLNGHKVQKTLDVPNLEQPVSLTPNTYEHQTYTTKSQIDNGVLHTRSIALNVSLRQQAAKNFTCTVWNDDSSEAVSKNYPFDIIDLMKAGEFDTLGALQMNRMHHVTIRIHGPPLPILDTILETKTFSNRTSESTPLSITESLLTIGGPGPYDYLFIERFSLLQLLGAIFGTFIVTLALLYAVTHFLSCFCHFPHLKLKHSKNKHPGSKLGRFSLIHPHEMALFTPERSPLNASNDASHSNTFNCDSAFSFLTSGTNKQISSQGPSTVAVRKPNLPQSLLMTGVPIPPGNRESKTPPPNPAYWSMPEYTYTGTGSHEYDVPRPLDSLTGHQSSSKQDSLNFPGNAQILFSMTNPQFINGSSILEQGYNHNAVNVQPSNTMPAIPNLWQNQLNPDLSTLDALLKWGQLGNNSINGFPPMMDRQLPCISYTQYPSNHSAIYTPDYPAYLQSRPYPHHKCMTQPIIQIAASRTDNHTLSAQSEKCEENGDKASKIT